MDSELRLLSVDELEAFAEAEYVGFGEKATPAYKAAMRNLLEPERTMAAFDTGRMVATASAFSFEMTVPGPAHLPAAGVTGVTVHPTHRRRGLLTRMMRRQLDDVTERGEPLAILTASEGGIYGRYGYGPAIDYTVVEMDRHSARLARPVTSPGRLVMLDRKAVEKVLPGVWDRYRRIRVGQLSRTAAFWHEMLREDGVFDESSDGGVRFDVVHERAPGEADGFVSYKISSKTDVTGRSRRYLAVIELAATDELVNAALWQYVLGVDLVDVITTYRPPDDPLRWLFADTRQARATRRGDHIWVRLADVAGALAARAYDQPGRLVVEVADAFLPDQAGIYELVADDGGATCRRVTSAPDLSLDVADLGSAYLGGVRFGALARGGRVTEHTPGSLRRADRMFAVDPLPWCDTDF